MKAHPGNLHDQPEPLTVPETSRHAGSLADAIAELLSETEGFGDPQRAEIICGEIARRGVLMPREPTESMINAGLYHNHQHNSWRNMVDSYKAMVEDVEYQAAETQP